MRRAIYIDDDRVAHNIMSLMVSGLELPLKLTCTFDADVILEYLELHRESAELLPDVILTDLYMPDVNGYSFLESFRALKDKLAKKVAVYTVSSSILTADVNVISKFPFLSGNMIKPVSKEKLAFILA